MSRTLETGSKAQPALSKDKPTASYFSSGTESARPVKETTQVTSFDEAGAIILKYDSLRPLPNTCQLMGGPNVMGENPESAMQAHDLLMKGLPNRALDELLGRLESIKTEVALELGLGISLRTHQRAKNDPTGLLSPALSGKAWTFASILSQAIAVFGSQKTAEEWIQQPSMALDQRTPISLLASPEGVEMVKTVLGRIEYGVYT
jgi:putative toxin-antitoxin system antitoxin component (TIGR02293 family)